MLAAMIEMGRFTTFLAFMNERLILPSVSAKQTARFRPTSPTYLCAVFIYLQRLKRVESGLAES